MSSGSHADIPDRKLLETALAGAGDLVYAWDIGDDSITWFGDLGAVFGAAADRVRNGVALEALIHADDRIVRRQARTRHTEENVPYDCEFRIRAADGAWSWLHDRGSVIFAADGSPARMTGILRLVNHRKSDEVQIGERASYDDLTGQFNRNRLRDAVDHALDYSRRYRAPGAFIAIGIDNLTKINNAFGYQTADSVIVNVSQRLDRQLRSSDVIGRLDGDRFGILLTHCRDHEVSIVAEKILDAVRETPVDTTGGPVWITASAGGVCFPASVGQTAEDVMRRADLALQDAKVLGRDCFVAYSPSVGDEEDSRHEMMVARKVQQALREDHLLLHFQPVVRASDNRVAFHECLARMYDDDGTLIPAADFIPVVEQMGLVRAVDQRVLGLAVAELEKNPEIELAINVSGLTCTDRSWLRLLLSLLRGRPDLGRRLIIEITETVALHDIEETARFVNRVRDLGCRVALDDFGAGYTSFRHLQALSVDMVKIDGSFVRNLANDLDNQLFVRTLLSLARGFGLETVAECVETAEDVKFLAAQGVNYLQGYYLGRPEAELQPHGGIMPAASKNPPTSKDRSASGEPAAALSA